MKAEIGAPNIDGLHPQDIWELVMRIRGQSARRRAAREWFGGRRGAIAAVKEIEFYARLTFTARACRQRGEIQSALHYEECADRVYQDLPEWAKW